MRYSNIVLALGVMWVFSGCSMMEDMLPEQSSSKKVYPLKKFPVKSTDICVSATEEAEYMIRKEDYNALVSIIQEYQHALKKYEMQTDDYNIVLGQLGYLEKKEKAKSPAK